MIERTHTDKEALDFLSACADYAPVEIPRTHTDTRAWFATVKGAAWFVKWFPVTLPAVRLETEIAIAGGDLHPAIIPLRRVIDCADGTLLFYERVDGETLSDLEARQRIYALPFAEKFAALAVLFDALSAVTEAGYTLVDVYEGNIMYDYARRQLWCFDWDLSRPGDGFTLEMDRNYGSSRLMAPEEFARNEWIDARTNVFNLGRIATLTLPEASMPLKTVLVRATNPDRPQRYPAVRAFADAFVHSLTEGGGESG